MEKSISGYLEENLFLSYDWIRKYHLRKWNNLKLEKFQNVYFCIKAKVLSKESKKKLKIETKKNSYPRYQNNLKDQKVIELFSRW